MVTSLRIPGFCDLVKTFSKTVHRDGGSGERIVVFVNKEAPAAAWSAYFDYYIEADADAWVQRVLKDWKREIPEDWPLQSPANDAGSTSASQYSLEEEGGGAAGSDLLAEHNDGGTSVATLQRNVPLTYGR